MAACITAVGVSGAAFLLTAQKNAVNPRAAARRDTVLEVALSRMETYSIGHAHVFADLSSTIKKLMSMRAPVSNCILRQAEKYVLASKRSLALLRKVVLTRPRHDAEVLAEFDEVANVISSACDNKLFNFHQEYIAQ